jgi:hypothetical protein
LIEDEYYTGQVAYNQTSFFYYPLSRNTGEMVIILNKTGAIGNNGDSILLVNLMSESVSRPFSNWTYPRLGSYNVGSSNNKSSQPEIIEFLRADLFKTLFRMQENTNFTGLHQMYQPSILILLGNIK